MIMSYAGVGALLLTSPSADLGLTPGIIIAKENDCDFIVALGGGSCIDAS